MGQYYKALLIDNEGKAKVINPCGWKLMEHSWYGNNSMMRIEKLLYRNIMNVMWIGDYAYMSSIVWKHKFEDEEDRGWEDRYGDEEILKRDDGFYYLVNKTSNEFINMTRQEMNKNFQDDSGWVVHPLPILCKAPGDGGGGDYRGEIGEQYIGHWCGDLISVYHFEHPIETEFLQEGYKDMTNIYYFKE